MKDAVLTVHSDSDTVVPSCPLFFSKAGANSNSGIGVKLVPWVNGEAVTIKVGVVTGACAEVDAIDFGACADTVEAVATEVGVMTGD